MADTDPTTPAFTSYLLYLRGVEGALGERLSARQKLMALDCFQNDLEIFEAALRIFVSDNVAA